MPASSDRTLVFLDVDGTLIPFGGGVVGIPDSDGTAGGGNPLLDRLDPALGPRLLALRCELVWATTWMAQVNEEIAPKLGLPVLPVVDWSEAADDPPYGLHWKIQDLVAWAAGRPLHLARRRDPPHRPVMGRGAPPPRPRCYTASTRMSA